MHTTDAGLVFSATDLSHFLACPHLTRLDRAEALGLGPKRPIFDDPATEVLRKRGLEHEHAYRARLEAEGRDVVAIEHPPREAPTAQRWTSLAETTLDAMRTGADVLYQGCLFDGTWLGFPDFLVRVDAPSDLGPWSYDIVDTKLAREAKGGALLQLCTYADLLTQVQGVAPSQLHLVLGGPTPRTETFRLADYAAYYRSVKRRFLEWIRDGAEPRPAPDPVEHCAICAWSPRCDAERRDVDHLSLVAGISRIQREAFTERSVTTVVGLSEVPLPIDPPLARGSAASAERVREQARVQVAGRQRGEPVYELLQDVVPGEGLAALPPPSPGDLFFDIEGDPYAFGEGLEYLLGFVDVDGRYTAFRALDRAQEKAAFEAFMDLVTARLEAHPSLHVYHYHHYEPTHLKHLMGRHATREDELDRLLRGKVLVDLHRVVRQGLRASVESYSIKQLESLYGYKRTVDLKSATHALSHFEAWLELGGEAGGERALFEMIEGYNQDDCVSTLRLRHWLEGLRDELAEATGAPVPRPPGADPMPSEEQTEAQARVQALVDALTEGVPADPEQRDADQHARWVLAQLLGWHRRENKSKWWEYFRCLELSDEEMIEDGATLGGLAYAGIVETIKRSDVHRYRFPPQDHGIKVNRDAYDPATESKPGTVVAIDDYEGWIDLKRATNSKAPHPKALIPRDILPDGVLRESLIRVAEATLERGWGDDHPVPAAVDLLLRRDPRVGQDPGAPLMVKGDDPLKTACRLVERLDRSLLAIQGPPGSGKTYTGAHMILKLLDRGLRVGVTGHSHKVIGNLLETVCKEATRAGVEVAGIQKCDEDDACDADGIRSTDRNEEVRDALANGDVRLAAGSAWLWSREDMAGSVDVLFVDEAGQYALANAVAVCPAATSVVLLGDPQQLQQPQQGVHPPGADVSALEHLLEGHATMPAERGLFLQDTWRLHPAICAFTSEVFYESRLVPRPGEGLERQAVRGPEPLVGSGLRLLPVDHHANQSESPEEVEAIARLLEGAVGSARWIDKRGVEHLVDWGDILVVAPYNAQVSALKARLPAEARVGTVDKFQGQEAPLAVYSVTTSSSEDAPRGMGFLYDGSRLNVATSRARCLTVIVANLQVFAPECRTPQQMKMANAFCRYREMAG
jgi:uncharacterized protein